MNKDLVVRFFGGSPASVLIRLAVLSFILGIVFNALGVSPFDIVDGFRRLAQRIADSGFETVVWAWRYFVIGAVIVFPIWVVVRLVKLARGRPGP